MKMTHRIRYCALGLIACASVVQHAHAAITIYESATLGQTGQYANSGFDIDAAQTLGWRFHLNAPFEVQTIGGNISGSGTFFGAIVPLSNPSAFPSGSPLDDTTIAFATFGGPGNATDISIPLSTLLVPGDYALLFGSGQFGTSGSGTMSFFNPDLPGSEPYMAWRAGNWQDFNAAIFAPPTPSGIRFVISGVVVPEPNAVALFVLAVGLGIILPRLSRIGSPGGLSLPAPTPPDMRVRIRRFRSD
jgi:hypothetical protein